jgi:hypothetical protein
MKSKISDYITINKLRELFELRGPDVVWKISRHPKIKIGSIAGALHPARSTIYRRLGVLCSDGRTHLMMAHQVAFAIHNKRFSLGILDHIDGDGLNNSVYNLREATNSSNMANRKRNTNNVLGVKGVRYSPSNTINPYQARVKAKGISVLSSCFATLEEATQAVREARTKHHGAFARHD